MATGAKKSKANWDSKPERKTIDKWVDIATSTVVHGFCANSDSDSEGILDSDDDSCAHTHNP